jgi:sporulation protein YlmC with PRC-barrel domain
MKCNTLKSLAAVAAVGLALQAAAFAADSDPSSSSSSSSSKQSSKKSVQASKLKGSQISSNTGENLGTIEEIVIDPDSGMVQFVILDAGPAAGGGQNYKAVPWQAFKADKSGQNLTLNTEKQKLQASPNIPKDHFADQTPEAVVAIYQMYQIQPPSAVGGTGSGSTSGQQQGQGQSSSSPSSSTSPSPTDPSSSSGQSQPSPTGQ